MVTGEAAVVLDGRLAPESPRRRCCGAYDGASVTRIRVRDRSQGRVSRHAGPGSRRQRELYLFGAVGRNSR
jgi:hypothetical protein